MLENVCNVCCFFACIGEGSPFLISFCWDCSMFMFVFGNFLWFDRKRIVTENVLDDVFFLFVLFTV
jgi:hypothetical protein